VFRDDHGKAGAFVQSSGCMAVGQLPAGSVAGRHRLDVAVDAGGPYFLQFSGHNDGGCGQGSALAAGFLPGVTVRAGTSNVAPMFAAAVEAFTAVTPPAVGGAEVVARAFHTATLGDDGSLLLAGGAQEAAVLGSGACARGLTRCLRLSRATSGIHRFDPASGATVLVGALADRRFLHSATALGDGRVAFAACAPPAKATRPPPSAVAGWGRRRPARAPTTTGAPAAGWKRCEPPGPRLSRNPRRRQRWQGRGCGRKHRGQSAWQGCGRW